MPKIGKGVAAAASRFVIIGILVPLGLDYFSPQISMFASLPPSQERWLTLILFGMLYATAGFLVSGYVKGDFPWLVGKILGGLVNFAFYSYVLLFLPSVTGSQNIQVTGLITLIYITIALSYLYLILDFFHKRRTRPPASKLYFKHLNHRYSCPILLVLKRNTYINRL